jgi:hypothetical protein
MARWRFSVSGAYIRQCQSGAHSTGARITDARRFVDDVEALAQQARKAGVTA